MPIGRNELRPIGINLSPNPGFRRGESGWVDGVWAFMVARGMGCGPFIDKPPLPGDPRRATIKALPSTPHNSRPYGW